MSVVQYLRVEGHDAVHLRELGLQQALDGDVYALATADQRVILTFDLALENSAISLSVGAIVVVDDARIRIKELPFER